MRKRSEREIERQKHWQEIVQGQQQSGQSVRAYCRAEAAIESRHSIFGGESWLDVAIGSNRWTACG